MSQTEDFEQKELKMSLKMVFRPCQALTQRWLRANRGRGEIYGAIFGLKILELCANETSVNETRRRQKCKFVSPKPFLFYGMMMFELSPTFRKSTDRRHGCLNWFR